MVKILVACPMSDTLTNEKFLNSVFKLKHRPLLYLFGMTGENFHVNEIRIRKDKIKRWSVIVNARNHILTNAMKLDWDYILWLDSDIEVYPELINNLLAYAPDEKVIAGYYENRRRNKTEKIRKNIQIKSSHIYWTGFGCMLIAREVHEKVGLFTISQKALVGEDVIYCHRIRDKGYKIFMAGNIIVNHFPS